MIGKKVLLVEDNKKIIEGNARKLTRSGYKVFCALSLSEARSLLNNQPDILVLDIMLPDGSGLEFMQEVRESEYAATPILLLTGLAAREDIVRGLNSGGDDYMTKPYDFDVLLARIEALIRRSAKLPEFINKGCLSIDVVAGVAMCNGEDLLLGKKECALLLIFAQNEGVYIEAEDLYARVWKVPMGSDGTALKSAIKRLRQKLSGSEWSIGWSRGEGYVFEKA
ncbi:MAG: response regulator transcription factor [Oscillospiraceae bacterium]|nr:response regulator transcription factor [Oscillospiraceae bacterium]